MMKYDYKNPNGIEYKMDNSYPKPGKVKKRKMTKADWEKYGDLQPNKKKGEGSCPWTRRAYERMLNEV